ncbi:MAG: hypothetical protein GY898_28460 [Proteobacteria bacterium]|nr:hypothetical protein [Pseudomonadota bacterium]
MEITDPEGALKLAGELYAQDGTPCATCTCSYMTLKQGAGTSLGFSSGGGLALRVCRIGREPLTADDGTQELWCEDYTGFASIVPISADDLTQLQAEASRGFLADLAQGVRPLPRTADDLRWYDRGFREGWLPPHRVEVGSSLEGERIRGPWEQFQVIGVTPAFGDGHTPALGDVILQAKDRRSYLLQLRPDAEFVEGVTQPHAWWVSQVSTGAALPLESPVDARRGARMLVVRGGESVLSPHACRYLDRDEVDGALEQIAEEAVRTAHAAMKRGQDPIARVVLRRGLRARPTHTALVALRDLLGD